MGRPNRDRVMVSFYLDRASVTDVNSRAERSGLTRADVYRQLIHAGLRTTSTAAASSRDTEPTRKGDAIVRPTP